MLIGGRPLRIVTLTAAGAAAFDRLEAGPSPDHRPADLELGRRLVDAGMAHPRWPPDEATLSDEAVASRVTVVVPARGRPERLERCLASLGPTCPVLVVDDASPDPQTIETVCQSHGTALVRHSRQGGPAAARNTGMAATTSELVAFLDSDCEVSPGWLHHLVRTMQDPVVGAIAPRVVGTSRVDPTPCRTPGHPTPHRRSSAAAYAVGRSPLDLGAVESNVGPGRRVTYVPTAALLVRRDALTRPAPGWPGRALTRPAPGWPGRRAIGNFDESLRYGEDVDLVWRLIEYGWVVRYDPTVVVHHAEPSTWAALLARRYRYGTSAGPLARRHPGSLIPYEVDVATGAAVVGAITGRWGVSALVIGARALQVRRSTEAPRAVGVERGPGALWWGLWGTVGALGGLGRWVATCGWPVLVPIGAAHWWRGRHRPEGCATSGGRSTAVRPSQRWRRDDRRNPSRRLRTRVVAVVVAVLVGPRLAEWLRARPTIGPVGWTAASVADDLAYGAGVWVGSVRARTVEPLVPRVRHRTGRTWRR